MTHRIMTYIIMTISIITLSTITLKLQSENALSIMTLFKTMLNAYAVCYFGEFL